MLDKILVPLDGSELAERALDPAYALAQKRGGEVILLRVPVEAAMLGTHLSGFGFVGSDPTVPMFHHDADEYMSVIRRQRPPTGFTLHTRVIDGDVAGVIVDTAADERVDLLIMSTHGYSGFTRWMLGSVTERVLHSASCPVLAVRSSRPIQNVLVTLDGSALAEQALAPALEIAHRLGSQATLLTAVPKKASQDEEAGRHHAFSSPDEAAAYLQDAVTKHTRPGLSIQTEVRVGPAASTILSYVERHGTDLLAMATHGYTGVRRWVYGSVTDRVVRGAHCDLLVVRPPAA
ncbi:MAG: universal stress protein, partial [Chloroflexota bacterium]